ncbi:MAG: D-Ala-D-Ala carboxypeptidase family metallohydrolase [Bacteroides sp.]|nr:D-Ala-D-Ala carboxypeptidase family metallohydrolase [Ruminococcus flavefaciens]MCM1554304.1 D-Ala-D-Ala carboxypeptidase family metallohydrolase [Bacteroides sp.]
MSKYFALKDLIYSRKAEENHIPNQPSATARENLSQLAHNVLDPIRELWGAPLYVTSGYRSRRLNELVGGAENSQHTRGQAADLTTGTPEGNQKLFTLIEQSEIPFDQLIDENHFQWLHISYSIRGNRKQSLHLCK